MSLGRHHSSISNLHMIAIHILFIDVSTYDNEVERKHKCLYKIILNKTEPPMPVIIILVSATDHVTLCGIWNYLPVIPTHSRFPPPSSSLSAGFFFLFLDERPIPSTLISMYFCQYLLD